MLETCWRSPKVCWSIGVTVDNETSSSETGSSSSSGSDVQSVIPICLVVYIV